MPKRGTQQNLRNFEAMALGGDPFVMVNAELLFGSMTNCEYRWIFS